MRNLLFVFLLLLQSTLALSQAEDSDDQISTENSDGKVLRQLERPEGEGDEYTHQRMEDNSEGSVERDYYQGEEYDEELEW